MLLKNCILALTKINKLLSLQVKRKNQPAFLSMKMKGGALYISIMVSILIGITLCMFILIGNYNQRTVTVYTQSSQLYYNLQSAFEIAQSAYFTEETNNRWLKNTVNDDSVKINKLYWGAYLLICAQTKNRHQLLAQSGLYGTAMTADTGLVIADNSRPVGLSGQVIFKANCYLPKAGVKPAYIEGQSYINAPGNAGFIRNSPNQVPEITQSFIDGVVYQQSESYNANDSVVNEVPNKLVNPFTMKTIVWRTNVLRLGNVSLSKNIKIIAGDLEVDSSCRLNNVLLVCKKVRFKEGFKGKIHVVAEDSIITEKNCEFNFPSSFVLLANGNESNTLRYIQLSEGCKFFGGVMAINKNKEGAQKVLIKLNAKSEVNGFIYSSDYLHLEGQVNATAMASKLLLKTPSAVYENHLLGCEINPGKYGSSMAIPLVFKQGAKLMCCEKMN